MPRISNEAKSAAVFRAGARRRAPPKHLRAPAKRLWEEIVNDRPADYFRAGSYEMLEQYVALTIQQRDLLTLMARQDVADTDYQKMLRSAVRLLGMLVNLGRQLRLTIHSVTRSDTGKLKERDEGSPDPLLGGAAIWGSPVQ